MSDLNEVLRLWRDTASAEGDFVLATIIAVDGSSYRKSGARMLVARSGIRAGTISGGCLENEVVQKAWWRTERGPGVHTYSTDHEPDGRASLGAGCGGIVHILLERSVTASPLLKELDRAFRDRTPAGIATIVDGPCAGAHCIVHENQDVLNTDDSIPILGTLAGKALERRQPHTDVIDCDGQTMRVWSEYVPARMGLYVFGAGDDARPLVTQARTLGWRIVVGDGRRNLATSIRFPEADDVRVTDGSDLQSFGVRPTDAVVLMTHSFEQDRRFLTYFLDAAPAYIGVLGPRHRTLRMLHDIASPGAARHIERVHSPAGLKLPAESPAAIALAIIAEIQLTCGYPRNVSFVRTAQLGNENEITVSADIYRV
jgi:xanthine/CO dehydrogenase XdhC/CoxF family maturation factor